MTEIQEKSGSPGKVNSLPNLRWDFLHQEIRQLQNQVKHLEEVVRINKEALKTATSSGTITASNYDGRTRLTSDAALLNTSDDGDTTEFKSNNSLVDYLQEENSHLLETVRKLINERDLAQSKTLLSEQLLEEAQRREKENLKELVAKIQRLQNLLQEKDRVIQEYQRTKKNVVSNSKLPHAANPSEDTLRFQREIESLYDFISNKSREITKLKDENQDLKRKNKKLLEDLNSKGSSDGNLTNNLKNEPGWAKADTESKLATDPAADEPQDISQFLVDDPRRMQPTQPKTAIPKLDLAKAVELQLLDANLPNPDEMQPSQRQDEQAAPVITRRKYTKCNEKHCADKLSEQIKNLEKQLNETKAQLSQEVINKEAISQNAWRIKMELTTCSATNVTLINANQKLEEKCKKMRSAYEFYKNFYTKYMENITKPQNSTTRNQRFYSTRNFKEAFNMDLGSGPIVNYEGVYSQNPKAEQLENSDEKIFTDRTKPGEPNVLTNREMTLEQSKLFLLELVKEVDIQSRFKQLTERRYSNDEKDDKNKGKKLQRSLSSPSLDLPQSLQEADF